MIVKQIEQEAQATNSYEFFTTKEMTTPDNETVEVLVSVGRTTLADLESQKESLTNQIATLDEKIKAIKAL